MLIIGRISSSDLECLYKGRIDEKSLICTDSHKGCIKFAKGNVAEHIRIPRSKYKNGVYHISHVNNFHSKFNNGWNALMEFLQSILRTTSLVQVARFIKF